MCVCMFVVRGGGERNGSFHMWRLASPWAHVEVVSGLQVPASSYKGSVLRWGATQTDASTAVGRSHPCPSLDLHIYKYLKITFFLLQLFLQNAKHRGNGTSNNANRPPLAAGL